jgi:metal-responsive CopG/Arc/MetJ family transcriptional regulator
MRRSTKKATFSLDTQVLAALDDAMARGLARSKNSLVEQALQNELRQLQKEARRKLWAQGSRDSLLLKDVRDVEAEFRTPDAETARSIA